MSVDVRALASDLLSAAHHAEAELTIKMDIGAWPFDSVREWVNHLLDQAGEHKRRIKGIRTDYRGFTKLGIDLDRINSGIYKGVPIVIAPSVDFDEMEVVFVPVA